MAIDVKPTKWFVVICKSAGPQHTHQLTVCNRSSWYPMRYSAASIPHQGCSVRSSRQQASSILGEPPVVAWLVQGCTYNCRTLHSLPYQLLMEPSISAKNTKHPPLISRFFEGRGPASLTTAGRGAGRGVHEATGADQLRPIRAGPGHGKRRPQRLHGRPAPAGRVLITYPSLFQSTRTNNAIGRQEGRNAPGWIRGGVWARRRHMGVHSLSSSRGQHVSAAT